MILRSNINELITKRQQGGVLTTANGDWTKLVKSVESDEISLGY